MIKIVIDTNIFISSLLFDGKPEIIIDLISNKEIQGFISLYILFEVKDVLVKKFKWDRTRIERLERLIKEDFIVIYPKISLNLIKAYPVDNHILECAVEAHADFLITGDRKHILKLKRVKKTYIVTAEEFLKYFYALKQ